jgi:hypothetical protein
MIRFSIASSYLISPWHYQMHLRHILRAVEDRAALGNVAALTWLLKTPDEDRIAAIEHALSATQH